MDLIAHAASRTVGGSPGISGRVYGALLNHRSALAALGDKATQPPYQAAPVAPVLYLKPRNTLAHDGDAVVVPADAAELEITGSLGVVIGRTACNVGAKEALDFLAGYVVVNDLCLPHSVFYRPSIRYRARDGFCPLGPRVIPRSAVPNPDALTVRVLVDGEVRSTYSTADLVRPVARLLVDVTEFMTLSPGDVLIVGAAAPLPRARAGQTIRVDIERVACLENRLIAARGPFS
jgi:5-oxopent-3-ene-1,2,5-tricarboxylate decarboxylase / 2-hydroxyhepta-2,4-diene-1,7-dioate isomerase